MLNHLPREWIRMSCFDRHVFYRASPVSLHKGVALRVEWLRTSSESQLLNHLPREGIRISCFDRSVSYRAGPVSLHKGVALRVEWLRTS